MRTRLPAYALGLVLVLSGCGIPAESLPRVIPSDSATPVVPAPSPTPTVVTGPQQQVSIYLVQDGELVAVPRLVPERSGPGALLGTLLQGPDNPEKTEGYRSVAIAGASADEVVPADGLLEVRLPPRDDANELPPADQMLGFAQIVLTMTAVNGVRGVAFSRDGMQIQVPRDDLNLSPEGQPVTAADYRSLVQEPS